MIELHHCCCPGGLLGGIGWSCFISFHFLCIEAATRNHASEVHHCYYPSALLCGLYVGRGGLGAISKGDCGLGLFCIISFPCLCVEATRSNHPIMVHYCYYPGGILGGIGVGRGGLYGLSMIGFVVSHPLFISFLFLCIKVATGDREIEVHHRCYPSGFVGGLGVG